MQNARIGPLSLAPLHVDHVVELLSALHYEVALREVATDGQLVELVVTRRRAARVPHFTAQQRAVARLLVAEVAHAEIADVLGISEHTVRRHYEQIFRRLGVSNRRAAVLALRECALELEGGEDSQEGAARRTGDGPTRPDISAECGTTRIADVTDVTAAAAALVQVFEGLGIPALVTNAEGTLLARTADAARLAQVRGLVDLRGARLARDGVELWVTITQPRPEVRDLTSRQQGVAYLLADGCGNEEIATRLGLSVHTVRRHVEGILERLGVRTRREAAMLVRHRAAAVVHRVEQPRSQGASRTRRAPGTAAISTVVPVA